MPDFPAATVDPAPLFELFRGSFATDLLVAATAHLGVFDRLSSQPMSIPRLQAELDLADRPAVVLITALRAMGLLRLVADRLELTTLAREHLVRDAPLYVGDYFTLAAGNPGVKTMVRCLRTNRPVVGDGEPGVAFIQKAGLPSAMKDPELARKYTLALAGRAKVVAPRLAEQVDAGGARMLVDVAGGSGIYAIAMLKQYPKLRAILLELPQVIPLAAEQVAIYGVGDRLELREFDMLGDQPLPAGDLILLSNVLHDWDVPDCRQIVRRCAAALPKGGWLLIHDVFLNDPLDGPLPIALYSAALFTLTEGRAYSAAEYRPWLLDAGLNPNDRVVDTLIHCKVLTAAKT